MKKSIYRLLLTHLKISCWYGIAIAESFSKFTVHLGHSFYEFMPFFWHQGFHICGNFFNDNLFSAIRNIWIIWRITTGRTNEKVSETDPSESWKKQAFNCTRSTSPLKLYSRPIGTWTAAQWCWSFDLACKMLQKGLQVK